MNKLLVDVVYILWVENVKIKDKFCVVIFFLRFFVFCLIENKNKSCFLGLKQLFDRNFEYNYCVYQILFMCGVFFQQVLLVMNNFIY